MSELADIIAAELFIGGMSIPADRLVMEGSQKLNGPGWCQGAVRDVIDRHLTEMLADNAKLRERVTELENERFTLRQILHDIAFFSLVADGRLHNEYENGWNEAAETITQAAQKHFTDKGLLADDFDKLDEQIAQRDAEIARLREDEKRLEGMIRHHLVCERTFSGWYRVSKLHEDGFAVERTNDPSSRKAIDEAIKAAGEEGDE